MLWWKARVCVGWHVQFLVEFMEWQKKRPELSCKGKDLRISAALKSELNLFSLFQTFSYVLSTVSSSDEEKKGEVAASFLMY